MSMLESTTTQFLQPSTLLGMLDSIAVILLMNALTTMLLYTHNLEPKILKIIKLGLDENLDLETVDVNFANNALGSFLKTIQSTKNLIWWMFVSRG